MRQADGEYLIGTNGYIRRRTVGYVIKASRLAVPEQTVEAPTGHRRHVAITLLTCCIIKPLRQIFHNAKCVVPESLNLHGFASARSHDPVANLGIHPGKLHPLLARRKQAAGIYFDSVPSAASVPG